VVMDAKDYDSKLGALLKDEKTHKKLSFDPTDSYKKKFKNELKSLNEVYESLLVCRHRVKTNTDKSKFNEVYKKLKFVNFRRATLESLLVRWHRAPTNTQKAN